MEWINQLTSRRLMEISNLEPSEIIRTAPFWMHPYLESCKPLVVAQTVYLVVVFLAWTYPSMFPQRKKTRTMTLVMQFHNFILVVWSSLMCFNVIYQVISLNYKFVGNSYHVEHVELAYWVHHFGISKIYEFLDTFIMIYRGNLRQVSFLHVYHHVMTSWLCWYASRVGPGGDAWHAVALNSFVHIVMYTYYFMSTIIVEDSLRRKYLGWGKYLTQLQMTQFVAMTSIHTGSVLLNKAYPIEIPFMNLVFVVSLFGLFLQFYLNKWTSSSGKLARTKKE
eukprot:TRINITY_DN12510_c0_g1_i1.p1 TRINITY_DN12510_c0_g1~~TRINITY_DN12510_c0_g1_i1.p1  ORF type:complete len:279 (+),score=44.47 TRINITY_DN12510_c0_g1_i1:28-864(+)